MTLKQEAHTMLDLLSNDDSVKFIMDMIKKTEQISDSHRNQFIKEMGWAVNDFEKEIKIQEESEKEMEENQKKIMGNYQILLKKHAEIEKKSEEIKKLREKIRMEEEIKRKEEKIEGTLENIKGLIKGDKVRYSNDEKMLAALEEASTIIELFHVNPLDMESIRERVENFSFVEL